MTAALDRLLSRLEWRVVRRLDGRLQGGYRTTQRGSGLDFVALRSYTESDDARHIDWNATARLDEPMVREFLEDRELTCWLVLDRSASMTVGPPGRGKDAVLTELALVLTRLFARGGNRVGAVLYGTEAGARVVRPGTGRGQALVIAAALERTAQAPGSGTTDLAEMLDAAASVARRRSVVIVVSDFIGTGSWERSLALIARRHEVVALRLTTTGDDALPEVGLLVVEDAETGEQVLVDAGDPIFRARLRDEVGAREQALGSGMRRAGVPLHRIDTEADLVDALVGVVAETRWRGR